jgi:NTE family protein
VVDVGFPLLERKRLASAPVISNQMIAILIRRETQRQRETLDEDDFLIDPKLGEASSFDFSQIPEAIEIGRKAATEMAPRLAEVALPPERYARYLEQRAAARTGEAPTIEFVRVEPGSERYRRALEKRFESVVGERADANDLGERVTLFYGQGNLETLDYQVVKDEHGRNGLALTARRNSWGPNYVRFGLNLQDDFEGSSSYNAAARFVLSEITRFGGEWVWDLQIGDSPRIATEWYLPLTQGPGLFFSPHAQVGARNIFELSGQTRIAEVRLRSFDYGLDVGYEFGNWGEVRTGHSRAEGTSRVRLGTPTLPPGEFHADSWFGRLTYDRLDDVNFPKHGQTVTLQWDETDFTDASNLAAERMSLDWLIARSWGKQTAVLWTSAGTTLGDDPPDVRSLFGLGGFLNLSGLQPDSVTGPHFGIVRALVYRQIGRAGPGFLDVPAYVGLSYEMGNVWNDRDDASSGSARRNGSIYLGLDTLLGPVYLASGFDEDGEQAFYLFLGRTF